MSIVFLIGNCLSHYHHHYHPQQGEKLSWAVGHCFGWNGNRYPGFQHSKVSGFQGSRVPRFQGSPVKIGDTFNHQSWYLTQTSLLDASWWQPHVISQGLSLDPPNGNQPMEITHPKKGMFHHAENCHIWFPEGIYFIWGNVLWYDYLNSGTNFSFITE